MKRQLRLGSARVRLGSVRLGSDQANLFQLAIGVGNWFNWGAIGVAIGVNCQLGCQLGCQLAIGQLGSDQTNSLNFNEFLP